MSSSSGRRCGGSIVSQSPFSFAEPVAADLARVDELLEQALKTGEPETEEIARHLIGAGGKRMRPLVALLVARVWGYQGEDHHRVGTIIELLHSATLLHDDVVDGSVLRRGRATVNALWSNGHGVLVGDYIYSRAFELIADLASVPVLLRLSRAGRVIAEGELRQLRHRDNLDMTEESYLAVVHSKTAELFAAAAWCAAQIAGADEPALAAMEAFGLAIGESYQMTDDLLDYLGDVEVMGKNLGDDLAEGKMTLPLIRACNTGSPETRRCIERALSERGGDIDAVMAAVRTTDALDYTRWCAEQAGERARAVLRGVPDSVFTRSLLALANAITDRHY